MLRTAAAVKHPTIWLELAPTKKKIYMWEPRRKSYVKACVNYSISDSKSIFYLAHRTYNSKETAHVKNYVNGTSYAPKATRLAWSVTPELYPLHVLTQSGR